jgi:hypothetical protein
MARDVTEQRLSILVWTPEPTISVAARWPTL